MTSRMEQWLPLFEILLNSPSPEGEASFWFQEKRQQLVSSDFPAADSPRTTSFLSLLLSPVPTMYGQLASSNSSPLILMQTLPFAVQTRILSILAADYQRFSPHLLRSLAAHILKSDLPSSSDHPAFWVRRAACNLFDVLPPATDLVDAHLEDVQRVKTDEFNSLPHWLEDLAKTSSPLLPWLPVDTRRSVQKAPFVLADNTRNRKLHNSGKLEAEPLIQSDLSGSLPPINPQARDEAAALKGELLSSDSTVETIRLTHKIQQLCLKYGAGNELTLLGLIEPWELNDEMLSVMLSHISNDITPFSKSWPTYILCSTALPKMLALKNPASRVLLSAIICFCKKYQTAAVEALLFPLMLHKEGINVVQCDVLVKITKECLHPAHVSAFCQRLLCGGKHKRFICLPCQKDRISDEVVWTESLFTLFQNILNQNVQFTPDTADHIVAVVDEMGVKFSKSLKYGNFLLCFVTKCIYAVNTYKKQLRDAAEKTSTLVTRSILSRLNP
ncbi:hypothetical protein HPP92_004891 [Vanilla planifolia]|uniref:Fanconi Anaemia group E protein C-terminal domain-containing protein n=1 Tax=Vanilla planifolia TaxID=51239 RepID=A0A835VCP7_VANPL|nr:hypothetical protein HPP92_004891 [Vanilla planifolia]